MIAFKRKVQNKQKHWISLISVMSSLPSDPFETQVHDIGDDYLLALSIQELDEEVNSCAMESVDEEMDYNLALHLSLELNGRPFYDWPMESVPKAMDPKTIVDPGLELTDPTPNIWELMKTFDHMFFKGVLMKNAIDLNWSKRMTRCAGLCYWHPTSGQCSVRLSLPLLQLRSRKDLVETLIHELIHALLFVTHQNDNHESHGNVFHEHMYRINRESGADVSVYHHFHDEVNHYLTHVWRCDGRCRMKSPYYGYVRRSINRKPSPHDYWFKFHENTCGGNFIKEDEPKKCNSSGEDKTKPKQSKTPEMLKNKDIRSFGKIGAKTVGAQPVHRFPGSGHRLGSKKTSETNRKLISSELVTNVTEGHKQKRRLGLTLGSHANKVTETIVIDLND